MRKFFSFVLLAVGLLVSTNMQADNVAKIGTTEYATLQAAFNAVQDGETIVMIDNIAIGSTVTINKADQEITLDLAGKSWNFNDGTSSIDLGLDLQAGDLIITGFGGMKDSVASATFVRTAVGTSLVIENGNFTNKGAAAGVDCKGDVEIEGAWVNYVKVDGSKASLNGTHVNTQVLLANAAEATVYGGSIEKIAGNGTLTVKAGTITTIENAGTNLCEGGTVTTIVGGTNTIEGGKFTALNATGATYTLKGGLFASNTFVGGAALNTAVAQGYSVKANAGSFASSYPYQVSKDLVKIVETNVIYGTIGEALSAAKNNETVQLLSDVILGGNLNVYLAGKVTLDLNGKAWKLDDGHSYQQAGMRVYTGELVVTGNGSIVYSGESGSCTFFDMKKDTKLTIENGTFSTGCITCDGELTINGGTMKAVTLGNNAPALTINGGTITSQLSLASYPVATVEVVVNDGTIENLTTMNSELRGNRVTINGGTITWLQNSDSTFINDGTITNINGGFIVISDGMFTKLYCETNPAAAPYYRLGSYTINGGVFASDAYVTDEGSRKIEINVPADQMVIPNDDPATMAAYPYKLGVNPYKFYREVAKGNWGTVCYEKKVTRVTNAKLYEFVARNSAKTQVMVQEVAVDTITLGRPYLFNALNDEDQIFAYDNNVPATAGSYNGLIGTLVDYETTEAAWVVKGTSIIPAAVKSSVPAFRAYVNVDAIAVDDAVFTDQATAPKRGRLIFNLPNTPTEIENVNANGNANGKMMIDGKLVIVKDGKMFNAQGAQL